MGPTHKHVKRSFAVVSCNKNNAWGFCKGNKKMTNMKACRRLTSYWECTRYQSFIAVLRVFIPLSNQTFKQWTCYLPFRWRKKWEKNCYLICFRSGWYLGKNCLRCLYKRPHKQYIVQNADHLTYWFLSGEHLYW